MEPGAPRRERERGRERESERERERESPHLVYVSAGAPSARDGSPIEGLVRHMGLLLDILQARPLCGGFSWSRDLLVLWERTGRGRRGSSVAWQGLSHGRFALNRIDRPDELVAQELPLVHELYLTDFSLTDNEELDRSSGSPAFFLFLGHSAAAPSPCPWCPRMDVSSLNSRVVCGALEWMRRMCPQTLGRRH